MLRLLLINGNIKIGPCIGIESGDQLWVSRWIMERVSEKYNSFISWEPKPIKE